MEYELGQIYEFEVIKDYGESEDFFRLRIPGYGEGRLNKLKFQKQEPMPDRLRCRIKFFNNGFPMPGHYMPQYVNRFYRQGFEHHSSFEFKVIGLPSAPGGNFRLQDKYGIQYNLNDDSALLAEGQKVLCRFTKLSITYFNLELANGDMRLPLLNPDTFLESIGVNGVMRRLLVKLMHEYLPEAQSELDAGSALWVVTAVKSIGHKLAEWFVQSDIRRHNKFFRDLVAIARTGGLYLMENSRFLRNLAEEQRRNLQAILTEAVENLDPFRSVLELVDSGRECEFVESLMTKLRESGYLYHPVRQFSLLMMIFRTEPELVQTYLGRIFETIMEWRLETWTTEPFRSAFVRQFEIYIRQTCKEIDLLPQADTQADIDRIEKIVTAIALQMLISGDSASAQYKRNRSLFYRYISLLRPVRSDELLDKAFYTLMGVNLPLEFTYDTIKEPTMLMTRATVRPSDEARALTSIHTFREGDIQITIDNDGIALSRTDDSNPGRVLPNGIMDWLSPQIYLSGVQSLSGGQLNNFDAHRRLWNNIENALFERRAHLPGKVMERRKADIGDRVKVHINKDEVFRSDNPMWVAYIDDDDYFDGEGYIYRDGIVGYNLRSSDLDRNRAIARSAFVDDNNRPRHFYATVESIEQNGKYQFSLLDDVAEQCGNIMNYNDIYFAVIAKCDTTEYSAIAETGYGVHLQRHPGDPEYGLQDIVAFRVLSMQNPKHITGTIIYGEENRTLDKVFAFAALMKGISFDEENSDELDGSLMLDADETLTREDIMEIIELIRFKAISTTTLLSAYDYLHFARLLAMVIGDVQISQRLQIHASMLRLHQFYATNRRVDSDELEKFRSEVIGYPMLEVVFHRLEIVSWLGDVDRNDELWETVKAGRNLLESNLARLVLSVNMLPDGGSSDDALAEGLKTKIAQMLGVNFEARQLKSYGRENQFIEFKSSIVFPACKKGEKVKADPDAQQFVILKTIAGFLNSSGGTLYIGVNDRTHCEAGLFEDFEYYKHRKATNHGYIYDIKNIDNYMVFLSNIIRNEWGTLIGESIQISRDEEAAHDVVVVKVMPRMTPVFLNDTIFVRRSNNTMTLNELEQKEFVEERKMLELRRREELNVSVTHEETENVGSATPGDQAAVLRSSKDAETNQINEEKPSKDTIATSAWRPNVLHNWKEGYVEPAGYIYFTSGNTFKRTDEDRQYDYDNDCELALAYTAHEAQQGFMVMVFDGLRILKVPMPEIMEKDLDRPIGFFKDGKLIFATIAMPGDSLLSHLTDSKTTVHRRVVPLSGIESGHLNSNPELITDAPGVAGMVGCEIVASSALGAFNGSLEKDMSTRQIGYTLRTLANSSRARQIFEEDCKKCMPR